MSDPTFRKYPKDDDWGDWALERARAKELDRRHDELIEQRRTEVKATYIGSCAVPGYGATGEAFPASGFNHSDSIEHGAYLFVPDNEPDAAYYVDPDTDLKRHDELIAREHRTTDAVCARCARKVTIPANATSPGEIRWVCFDCAGGDRPTERADTGW